MKVQVFDFEFTYKKRNFQASCTIYTMKGAKEMPYKYPMYRVALKTKKPDPPVFILYRIDEPENTFFWYPVGIKPKGAMEEAIANTLQRIPIKSV